MNAWIDSLHTNSPQFPVGITALKLGVAVAIGLLPGFERQWSHKDFGVRTFSLVALLGATSHSTWLPGSVSDTSLIVHFMLRDYPTPQLCTLSSASAA